MKMTGKQEQLFQKLERPAIQLPNERRQEARQLLTKLLKIVGACLETVNKDTEGRYERQDYE
jgi:NTP pyrophosphatase (non-canonical NTP hydrolase)